MALNTSRWQRPPSARSTRPYRRTAERLCSRCSTPGVATSIDSDVDNIASLLKLSGLLPGELNIQPLLDDAKAQLHDEADYNKEAEFLAAFGDLLAGDDRFVVPEVLPDLTRKTVLAMTYVEGRAD